MLYNNLSNYLKQRYGRKIKKICIDGGFTCPNRDGTCGTGGCIFCGEEGAGEHIKFKEKSVTEQVLKFFENGPKGDAFIAYFQNFTNTYAPVNILKQTYDAALIDDRIVALAIGTRPDCITEEIAALLADYRKCCDVWVELGLQTANDTTAEIINRGYKREAFSEAVRILNQYQIPIVVHIIIGLPSEGDEDIIETVDFINQFCLWGIKIHSIYVMKHTALEKMYLAGKYAPPTMKQYVDRAIYVLTHIPPDMIVHRLTGDCPKGLLVAPDWNPQKNLVLQSITQLMEMQGYRQGCLYSNLNIKKDIQWEK